MKKTIAIFAFATITGVASAQKMKEELVPQAVKNAFAKKYPNAKAEKWEKEGSNYEAEFHLNKIENSSVFDETGNFLETEVEIPVNSLPAPVGEYVTKTLGGKKIKEASKITTAKGDVSYEAEIADDDYIFDAKGNFIRKEAEDGDND